MGKYLSWVARINLPTPRNPEPIGEQESPPISIKEGDSKRFISGGPVEITVDKRRYKAYPAKEDEDELVIVLEPKG